MAEPKRRYLVPGYQVTYFPPLRKHRPDVLKSTLTNKIKSKLIKLTITQMHTHFTQLYIAGNFHI